MIWLHFALWPILKIWDAIQAARYNARQEAQEVPPAEERPHIPVRVRVAIVSPESLAEAQAIEQALRAEFLRAAYAQRRSPVQVEIDRLVKEVGCV